MIFEYGQKEIEYLKQKDKRLAHVIDQIGYIEREVDEDLFSAIVHQMISQQISNQAQATIWKRLNDQYKTVDANTILAKGIENLRSVGISSRKAEYIMDFADKVQRKQFDLESLWNQEDDEVIYNLIQIKGIGVWTAEMILLFCMQRKNILSFQDYGIQKGLRMIYHHRKIDCKLFKKYKRRFSPYCSVASLYLWAVANGAISEMKDYAPKK